MATELRPAATTTGPQQREVLLDVRNLKMYFPLTRGIILQRRVGWVKAVDDVSFQIYRGETLGLVGESGCGKSTTGRAILQLYKPTAGQVLFNGVDLTKLPPGEMRKMRRHMQMIFQDPFGSLNPRMSVRDTLVEPQLVHGIGTPAEQLRTAERLLGEVSMPRAALDRYPHEFSGGQRQRIAIARAIAMRWRWPPENSCG